MFKCKCKYFVRFDKKRHQPGTELTLTREQLDDIGRGAFDGVLEISESDDGDIQQERMTQLLAAIGSLDADNAELWTKSGDPKTDALSAVTGDEVSADERNAAWTLFREGAE